MHDLLPMAAAIAPLGIAVGLTVARIPVPDVLGLASTGPLFSGSAQLTYLTLAASGAGLVGTAIAMLVVNTRLAVYGAALAPRFREQPPWFRWLAPTLIVDQSYLAAAAREDGLTATGFRHYWLTAGAVLGSVWIGTVCLAAWTAPSIPEAVALDLAAPALFLGLLVPRLRDLATAAATLASVTVTLVGAVTLGSLALPVAIVAGLAVLVAVHRPRSATRTGRADSDLAGIAAAQPASVPGGTP